MVNTLDILVVGAAAYYASGKIKEEDEGFNRLLYGAAAGIPAALKGPEAVQATKDYLSNAPTKDKQKAVGALVAGGLGYAFGDNVLGYEEKKEDNDKPAL